MREDVKDKWVAELRSGKHRQAIGRLLDQDGSMCCLGVLQVKVLGLTAEYHHTYLTGPAMRLAGMKSDRGTITLSDGCPINLPFMNDYLKKTFPEIADHIEEHWREM